MRGELAHVRGVLSSRRRRWRSPRRVSLKCTVGHWTRDGAGAVAFDTSYVLSERLVEAAACVVDRALALSGGAG
jgi:hypothetical protein